MLILALLTALAVMLTFAFAAQAVFFVIDYVAAIKLKGSKSLQTRSRKQPGPVSSTWPTPVWQSWFPFGHRDDANG